MAKHLELPQKESQQLIDTLRQVLTMEAALLWSSTFASDEEIAITAILLEAVKIQALNHLLVDAPIEITLGIIKGAVEISKMFLDFSGASSILNKIEKETVQRAVNYGISFLLENEIKVSPGAIQFKYISYKKKEREITLQYVMLHKKITNTDRAEIEIRFYMPHSIEAPDSQQHKGVMSIPVPDLKKEISPFIVKIKGVVEKTQLDTFRWVEGPLVEIDHSGSVPDLGIKPLNLLEKYILKPFEVMIKDVEVIITKVTGQSLGLTDAWNAIKSFVSGIANLSPAALFPTSEKIGEKNIEEVVTTEEPELSESESNPASALILPLTPAIPLSQETSPAPAEISLEELQRMLDDIAKQIDFLAQGFTKLGENQKQQTEEEIEKEEIERLEEKETDVCSVNINTVSKEELQKLIGIGPTIAQRIIDARPFYSVYDLIKVSGIGEITLQKIIEQDCAYVENDRGAGTPNSNPDSNGSGGSGGSSGSASASTPTPQIILSYSKDVPVDQKIEVGIFAINLKNIAYDVKISILKITEENEQKRTISEIYNGKDWQSSYKYLLKVFSKSSFTGQFKLRIKPDQNNFRGEAEIIAKIRDSNGKIVSEFKNKINITNPEQETPILEEDEEEQDGENGEETQDEEGNDREEEGQDEEDEDEENQSPVASFTFFPTEPLVDDLITFDASSSTTDGIIVNYIWDFGDGTATATTQEAVITHSYFTPGDFMVELIVVNDEDTFDGTTTIVTVAPISEIPTLEVVINEIAWMGTKASDDDEWIELYNNTTSPIDLTGWRLVSSGGSPNIIFSTSNIPADSYFLLERTDDTTVMDTSADLIYAGALKNNPNCEILSFYDQNDNLIDRTTCFENGNWPDGKNEKNENGEWLRISMERIDSTTSGNISSNWASNNLITRNGLDAAGNQINGTPKAENSVSKSETQVSSLPFDEGIDEVILTFYGSPYIVQWTSYVPADKALVIEPGVVVKFKDIYSGITVSGTLRATGTENEKIIFTSYKDEEYGGIGGAVAGDWRQIYFGPESSDSEMDNVIVRYGGAYPDAMVPCNYRATAVFVEESSIILKNSIIEDNRMKGVYLIDSFSTIDNVNFRNNQAGCHGSDDRTGTALHISGGEPIVENSLFQKNVNGIEIWSEAAPEIKNNIFEENEKPIYVMSASPTFGINQAINNNLNGILFRGSITKTSIWSAFLPYIIEDMSISEGATLIIDPGTVIRIRDANSGIEVKGILEAIGTEDEKIIFTSYYDEDYDGTGTGSWKHLRFYSSGSILENVIIRYGGMVFGDMQIKFGVITLENEDIEITVRDSILEKNKYAFVILNNSDCTPIERVVSVFKSENTVFGENEYDSYPLCEF
ncbi:MAG: helix-hairpin-helix domain-containing protein [Candidatus Paceibacterota bacterium]